MVYGSNYPDHLDNISDSDYPCIMPEGSPRDADQAIQHILIAQVEPPQDESAGDYYYRTFSPGRAMASQDGVEVINLTNVHRERERIVRTADVLIVKNVCDPDVLPVIAERKAGRLVTVFEMADDVGDIQPWNPMYYFYRNPENLGLFKRMGQVSDAMQFSVGELKRKYGYLNSVSEVFQNQISIIPPPKAAGTKDEIVIGWGGSHGHLEDMAQIATALVRWIQEHQGVYLHLMCSEPIRELFRDLPPNRKRLIKPGTIEDYYAFLRDIDIGLAPLSDTGFNRSRSDVKFLEYAVSSVVPLVQDLIPYRDSVRDAETGFFFRDPEELLGILEKLYTDRGVMARVAEQARSYVMKERLQDDHGLDRIGFYRTLLSAKGWQKGDDERTSSAFQGLTRLEGAVCEGRHLRLLSTRFEALLHDGLVLGQIQGDCGRAQQCFQEASSLEPHSYLPHLFGAPVSDDPVAQLKRALSVNPRSIKAWIMLGETHARQGDVPESLKAFESAAALFPGYDIPYVRVASVLQALGEKKAAEDMLMRAQALAVP